MDGLLGRRIAVCIGALCAACSTAYGRAQDASLHVLEQLGRGVEVRQYPVKPGSLDTFARRRDEATAIAVDEAIGALGTPLLREISSSTDVHLVYPKALVIVSGRYSNGIICRVDVPVIGLHAGYTEETVAELASRSCRSTEEKNWGASGFTATSPIGSEPLQEVPGGQARIYVTDELDGLFSNLVREVEVDTGARSSLIRQGRRYESFPRDGIWQWRYAWFENGNLLAVRYRPRSKAVSRRPNIGLACAVLAPGKSLPSLEQGAFAEWCNHQVERLSPALDKYVAAVETFRSSEAKNGSDTGIAPYGGFHQGPLPVQLTTQFWKTGQFIDPKP